MTRNWAAFASVSIVALLLAAIATLGATQGLFGFGGEPSESPQVINLRRTADGFVEAVGASSALPIQADSDDSDPGSRTEFSQAQEGAAQPSARDAEIAASAVVSHDGEEAAEDTPQLPRSSASITAEPGETTFQVGSAGLVTLSLGPEGLSIAGVLPAAGWRVKESEAGGIEAKVEFQGATQEIEFKARVVDGEYHVSLSTEQQDGAEAHEREHEDEYEYDD